ncbi:hypothetical protein [Pyrococcus sp. ST04]|uniref:hypothetical protein n=1 Tax=Pyrococcus sp. ST04 TaxID=1183377 RepID=UPI00064E6582|nr:hypothetical protein [Pyrococcus sp. ST04]
MAVREYWVSYEDIESIKAKKKVIKKILSSEELTRKAILFFHYSFLIRKKTELENRLALVKGQYQRFLKLKKKANNDREFLKRVRLELHRENERLREKLLRGKLK